MEVKNSSTSQDHVDVCPAVEAAFELLGKKWTGLLIHVLGTKPARFTTLLEQIPGVSPRLLTERLRDLECRGVVRRDVYPESPVRIEYALTEKGRALLPVMGQIADWAHDWEE